MVFGIIRNFVSSLLYTADDDSSDSDEDPNEIEQELLRKIVSDDNDDNVPVEPHSPLNNEVKRSGNDGTLDYKQKAGKITYICPDYGLIDKVYYFEPQQIPESVSLKVNDMVYYLSCKLGENQSEKVLRIVSLCDSSWDENKKCDETSNIPDVIPSINLDCQMINRVINGQVVERREREVFVKPSNIWVNLDQVEANYIPIEGDWVKLKAKVTVDEDVTDLTGEIIEIKVIEPLREKVTEGQVTLWHNSNRGEGEGAIDKDVYFNQECCDSGYIPSLGDKIVYSAIESQQGECTWRAISVIPMGVESSKENINKNSNLEQLLREKNGMGFIGIFDFGEVQINETKELTMEVKNFHLNRTHELIRVRFHTSKSTSQLRLKSPGFDDRFTIPPGGTVKYTFECKGKYVGSSTELVVFYFKNFKIGRNLDMNIIMDKTMNKLMPCDVKTHFRKSFHAVSYQNFNKTYGTERQRTFGARPKTAPKFIRGEKPGRYRIPEKLMNIIIGDSGMPKKHDQLVRDVMDYAGFLEGSLMPTNYNDWFHLLLYLEEAAVRLAIRRYDMEGVILKNHGEYLSLEVPGLQEQRPSLIIGDKVVVTQPWSETANTEHAGYIFEIRQKEVLLKFHPSFHDTYDESDCNVYFESSLSSIQKAHDAINRAMKKLGSKWLFPSSVQEKPCQLIFESIDDFDENSIKLPNKNDSEEISPSVNEFFKNLSDGNNDSIDINLENILHEKNIEVEYDVDDNGYVIPRKPFPDLKAVERKIKMEPKNVEDKLDKALELKKRKLVWFNKSLNYHQKASVVNVLKGQGRPLPYIIFGPPGTGKTITLVETILQIYKLIPESRIIIGTPSNSSADLICERIIDSGVLEPGELVRIMAYHRVCEGNIPEKLLPYCTTTDLRDDKGNPEMFDQCDRPLKQSTLSQLLGRHRITVGTCSALGSMHYMGFPPNHFTHIIVDEAGQAMEPEILIPITFLNPQSGQVILAGDPEQLGPTCISNVAAEYGLDQSLLYRFVKCFPYTRDHAGFPNTNGYDPRFITRLCINYRSLPEILHLPSQLFYNSELVPTISPTDSPEFKITQDFYQEIKKDITKPTPPAIIFHGVRGQNLQEGDCPSWFNIQEIWQCIIYLKKCYSIGLTADQCGIITPYKKQVQKLRQLLTELETPVPKIGTVEDFQGQERHVIILSPVRSTLTFVATDLKHSLGFIAHPRRLNVAITRARAILIIVGNPHVLCADAYWRSSLLYCVANDSYLGCDLPSNLVSEFLENKNEGDES